MCRLIFNIGDSGFSFLEKKKTQEDSFSFVADAIKTSGARK
jgi:hypothetical protein